MGEHQGGRALFDERTRQVIRRNTLTPNRRHIMAGAGAIALNVALPMAARAASFASKRPPLAQRLFTSPAVEAEIARVKAAIADPELAWMFENCYPNTLDTTVETGMVDGQPDTFVITGDITAMWLRDSSAQEIGRASCRERV